jgi:hypothetical protein
MNQIIKSSILLLALVSLSGLNLKADSSEVSNYLFSVDGMHQQEVLLILHLDKLDDDGFRYLIKRSEDGTNFRLVTQLLKVDLTSDTIVLADHLNTNTTTYYQLISVDKRGEQVISTISYDPDQEVEDAAKPEPSPAYFGNAQSQILDPHVL